MFWWANPQSNSLCSEGVCPVSSCQTPAGRTALIPGLHKPSLRCLTTRKSLLSTERCTTWEQFFQVWTTDFFLLLPSSCLLAPVLYAQVSVLPMEGIHLILGTKHQLIINQTEIKPIFPSSSQKPLIAHYPVLCSDTKVILLSGEFCCCFFFHKNC